MRANASSRYSFFSMFWGSSLWDFQASVTSEMCFDQVRQHPAPGWPVVVDIMTPDVQCMRDGFAVQHFRESSVGIGVFMIAAAGAYDDPSVSLSFEYFVVGQVRYIMLG